MSIVITDSFGIRSGRWLDDRMNVSSLSDLRNWDFSTNPLPDGFEVCVDGVWYRYNSANDIDSTLGKFRIEVDPSGSGSSIFASGDDVSEIFVSNDREDIYEDSGKLIKGGAIYEALGEKQDNLISGDGIDISEDNIISVVSDSEITESSTNPVQASVIYSALEGKQDSLTPSDSIEISDSGVISISSDYTNTLQEVLQSGVNIKTINNESILGSGNIEIEPNDNDAIFSSSEHVSNISLSGSKSDINSSSEKLIKGKAIYSALQDKQDKLTIDDSFSSTSTNPVQNKVIKAALDEKQDKMVVDTSLSSTSTNPVQNKAVKSALDLKQDKLTIDDSLSSTSTNPVQNKVIKSALDLKQNKLTAGSGIEINGTTISVVGGGSGSDITYTAGTGIKISGSEISQDYIIEFNVSTIFPVSGDTGGNTYSLQRALTVLDSYLDLSYKSRGVRVTLIDLSNNLRSYSFVGSSFNTPSDWKENSIYVEFSVGNNTYNDY